MPASQPGVGSLLTLGGTIVACVVAGLGLGLLADHGFHTLPVFTLLGLGLGVVAAGWTSYLQVRGFLRD